MVPFHVGALDVRGRSVQLGPALDAIIARHDYPAPVAALLAEIVVLTVLLGASLKFDGKFIVQTQTDGPVSFMVADFASPDAIRAYARYDADALEAMFAEGKGDAGELLGSGALAMTIDHGGHDRRYQGVVELTGDGLEDAACRYFRQSEQIPTRVRLAAAEMLVPSDGGAVHSWRAGGLIAQFLPEAPERMRQGDLPGGDVPEGLDDIDDYGDDDGDDEAWTEAKALVDTIGDDELTDPNVGVERLLYRLFHEAGVRVYQPLKVVDKCSCSRDKIAAVLDNFDDSEIEDALRGDGEDDEAGVIVTKCEFCSVEYRFTREELGASTGR